MGLGLMNTFETRYDILIMMSSIFLNALINDSIKLGIVYARPVLRLTSMGLLGLFYVSQDLLDTRGSRGK